MELRARPLLLITVFMLYAINITVGQQASSSQQSIQQNQQQTPIPATDTQASRSHAQAVQPNNHGQPVQVPPPNQQPSVQPTRSYSQAAQNSNPVQSRPTNAPQTTGTNSHGQIGSATTSPSSNQQGGTSTSTRSSQTGLSRGQQESGASTQAVTPPSSQQSGTGTRSYSQAAQNSNPGPTGQPNSQQGSRTNAQSVPSTSPTSGQQPSLGGTGTRSYSQAAQTGQSGGQQGGGLVVPVTPSPSGQQSGLSGSGTRSYSQAAQNTNQLGGLSTPRTPQTSHRPTPPPRAVNPSRSTTSAPGAPNVSDDELRTFSEDLLRGDTNNAGSTVRANWQGRTHGSNQADLAPAPLLTIPPRTLQIPTVAKMRALFDNYEPDSALAETVTPAEQNENTALLDAIMVTQVMTKTRRFLLDKNLLENTPGSLRSLLQRLWFTLYPRLGGRSQIGSSAFEHVFLAELRNGEVSGLHNWVFFAAEENRGTADYLGYIRRIDLGGRGSVVKHHFKWANVTKPVGSMFVGTSPELEMALYTVCYLTRPDNRCPVRLGGEPFFIKTHSFTYRGAKYIGSAFPDI